MEGDQKRGKYIGRNRDPKKLKIMPITGNVLDSESEVILCETNVKKKINQFANINHKQSFGANNWMKFLEEKPGIPNKLGKDKNSNHAHKTSSVSHNLFINPVGIKQHQNSNKYLDQQITKKVSSGQKDVETESSQANPLKVKDNCERPSTRRPSNKSLLQKNFSVVKDTISTKQIAMDCEMVGVEIGVKNSMLARVSLVNAVEDCIYDKYVKPTEPVLDYRTRFSGIRPGDLENASNFKSVQKEVADLIKGKILVGHALKNDLAVLFLSHPKHDIRDTSKYQKFRKGKAPALKKLAKQYLGVDIQQGEHNSVQDALAAMQLYRMFRREWEASIRVNRFKKKKHEGERSESTHTDSNILMNI